jgi:hypothetical protein
MLQLRLSIAATLLWVLVYYNIERFHEPINIASFVYVQAALTAMVMVALRDARKLSATWIWVGSIGLLLALKPLLGYGVFGQSLPLTVTEICALGITIACARQIARCIEHFEQSAADVMTMHLGVTPHPFETGQSEIYREIRRARQFERPLSLIAISTDGRSCSATINRFLREVRRNAIKNYIDARLASVLGAASKDCDILVRHDDRFVLVLPESDHRQANTFVEQITAKVQKELGLNLKAGIATFPDEEITFTGLLERAVDKLQPVRTRPHDGGPKAVNGDLPFDTGTDVAASVS